MVVLASCSSQIYLNTLNGCSWLIEELFANGISGLIRFGIRQQLNWIDSERLPQNVIAIYARSFRARSYSIQILCCFHESVLRDNKDLVRSKSSCFLLVRLHKMRNKCNTAELSRAFSMDRAGFMLGFWPS